MSYSNLLFGKHFKAALAVLCLATFHFNTASAQRIIQSFDKDWRFYKGDTTGAEQVQFNDVSWRSLDVPHDWSIEGPYDRDNPTSRGGGYLPAGKGWYRKSFSLDDSYKGKKVFIEFDGVMANSEVWINGSYLGKRPYGYISFCYELTKQLLIGKATTNILVVKADNSLQPASRYYTGAGIYRHVRLVATEPVHIDQWGIFITTPSVTADKTTVNIKSKVINASAAPGDYTIENTIIDATGKTVKTVQRKQKIAAGNEVDVSQDIELTNPRLWSFDQPMLYKMVTTIRKGKVVIDEQTNTFGIRSIRFEPATGFWINDKNVKLKGVCLHHDGGAVGAAVPAGIWRRRLALLKQAGVNAIRTAHNPVAPEFLDLCDEMGFAVMDETFDTWTAKKPNGTYGYNLHFSEWWEHDTRAMVKRDRNHPSIVIYSVGNEIHDNLNDAEGFKKYKDQQDLIHQHDGTRPVTMALFRPGSSKVYDNGFAQTMDVVGQNYRENELVAAHEAHADWKVIGTENGHTLTAWLALRDKPYMAGQFLWVGIDYLGEADWPATTHTSALFDRVGNWRTNGIQRQSWWYDQPVVHMVRRADNAGNGDWVADWTPADFGTYDEARIQVYSNCEEVELFLNGRSIGAKPKPADDSPRNWEINFEKGILKAVGRNNGKEVATEILQTAGAPAKIIISTDQPVLTNDFNDLAIVTATIVDANGIRCPNDDRMLRFTIAGEAVIAAVDNGNPISHESYQGTQYAAFKGKAKAIIKAKTAPGKARIMVAADGLPESDTIEISISQSK